MKLKNPKLTFWVLMAFVSGCASVKRQTIPHDLQPPLADGSYESRLAYYKTHSIQAYDGPKVKVNGKDFDGADKTNGLGFVDNRAHSIIYVPPYSDTKARAYAFIFVPAATVLGTLAGAVDGVFMTTSDIYGGAPRSNDSNGFTIRGAEIGAGIGILIFAVLYFSLPSTIDNSTAYATQDYNRRLWRAFDLGAMPDGQGTALRVKMKF